MIPSVIIFILRFSEKQMIHEAGKLEWGMSDLRDFILSEIKQRYLKPTLLLVDALDECGDSDVRDVDMLEMLSVGAVQSKTTRRICLSSRHYPSIDMKKKLELTVEKSKRHRQDIIKYITEKLEVEGESTRDAIQEKADGVFLCCYDESSSTADRTLGSYEDHRQNHPEAYHRLVQRTHRDQTRN